MIPLNHNKISLYQDAKSTLSSLVKQTTQVFIGFMIMLLLTGGNPSVFIIALTVGLGIIFVACGETKRLQNFKIRISDVLVVTPKTLKIGHYIYPLSNITNLNLSEREILYRSSNNEDSMYLSETQREYEYVLYFKISNDQNRSITSHNRYFLEQIINKINLVMNNPDSSEKYIFNLRNETIISDKYYSENL
ncbi:hypothetical protein [Crocosphaera sp. XPORK-15E]|uniref:hypothetical protein n=1 Tax=Crocosphaera sp. XPORK-15E TaxID=3110247 RepID=UPI002B21416E|nr:hypothetical protein [Crocosphaera sp. XPORK-15E]MEA5534509.1 hypothetical protein [Crocosphaera sp. XPORK-15E]